MEVQLIRENQGLVLKCGELEVCSDFDRMASRLRPANLSRELVVRAARMKGVQDTLLAVDATAGLGEDSLLLAAFGFHVALYERNPTIAALLRDGLKRGSSIAAVSDALERMELIEQNSIEALPHLDYTPQVVLLDPMFPVKQKSAAVKKKLQVLQQIEQPCDDEEALMLAAFAARPHKVVVKRPLHGAFLAGRAPSYSLSGKAIRFDCIVLPH